MGTKNNTQLSAANDSNLKSVPNRDPQANHGRLGFEDYPGLETVIIQPTEQRAGACCPECEAFGQSGRLYAYETARFIRLEGQPLVSGKRYQVMGSRCHLCSKIFKPAIPSEIKQAPKFSPSAISSIAMAHYSNGLPFYRIAKWQHNCGVPLPDATQYDEMAKLSKGVLPVVQCLRQLSANSDLFYYDDTPFKVLNGRNAHGTAIISQSGGHSIYLFCVGEPIAGKEVSKLLKSRQVAANFITMTDASRQNQLSEVDETLLSRAVIAYCLVHGRRKFYDLLEDYPPTCQFVIESIAKVYRYEAHCQKEKLIPSQRLAYHQQHSSPVMEALKVYLMNLWHYGGIEHNSTLGKAVKYMLTRWTFLTRFLSVEGCPLDNSLCERAIKNLIRYRKNSLFYKTQAGAECGNVLMSLIYTAIHNGINAFDYLNALQLHKEAVALSPQDFFPWNYQTTLDTLTQVKAA